MTATPERPHTANNAAKLRTENGNGKAGNASNHHSVQTTESNDSEGSMRATARSERERRVMQWSDAAGSRGAVKTVRQQQTERRGWKPRSGQRHQTLDHVGKVCAIVCGSTKTANP